MSCEQFREIISADIDGEATVEQRDHLSTHLGSCDGCRAFRRQSIALRSTTDTRAAAPSPDALHRTLRSVNTARDRWSMTWQERVQYVLAVISATLIVLNIPTLFDASDVGAAAHASRHLGAFGLAFGCGLLFAALRPQHLVGIMPFALAFGVAMLAGAIVDIANGASTMLGEAVHALEFTALVLVAVLAFDQRRTAGPALTDA